VEEAGCTARTPGALVSPGVSAGERGAGGILRGAVTDPLRAGTGAGDLKMTEVQDTRHLLA